MNDDLFTTGTVVPYLRSLGLIDDGDATAAELGGGVSNVVLLVAQHQRRLVLKQSLPQLRTTDEWLAPVGRVLTEARAIELAQDVLGGAVPTVRSVDADRHAIIIDAAPTDWTDWREQLMAAPAEPAVGTRLGDILGALHGATEDGRLLAHAFDNPEPFEVLRLDPYYERTALAVPAHSARLRELADALRQHRRVLIHGDFSPKNVLVDPQRAGRSWLIDWEVATLGDPAFDLAFLFAHLTMKAVHLPARAARLDLTARAFAQSYERAVPDSLRPDWPLVNSHVGALLLARVHGTSRADYLTAGDRGAVDRLGGELIRGAAADPDELLTLRAWSARHG